MEINAILLAAGLSQRMLGQNKMLMTFEEDALISTTYSALRQSKVGKIHVVTGRDRDLVENALNLKKQDKFVHNKHYLKGMTSSIQAGVASLLQSDAIMVCLGDMPKIAPQDYNLLIDNYLQNQSKEAILVPYHQGQRANPVIFGQAYFSQILNHTVALGCSGVIENNKSHVLKYEVPNDHFTFDIDTLDDIENH